MPINAESRKQYKVVLTDEAVYGYANVEGDREYARIGEIIDSLARFPYYGHEYDPYYRAALPPVPCRVFFCGRYGVYYTVDDDSATVTVLAVEDERRDPLGRFAPRR